NIKSRQPIGKMFIKAELELPDFFKQIIEKELNVKDAEFTQDVTAFTTYTFKAQMRTLEPKYGKLLNAIRTALTEVDGNQAMNDLNTTGMLKLNIEGTEVELAPEDVLTEMTQKE